MKSFKVGHVCRICWDEWIIVIVLGPNCKVKL